MTDRTESRRGTRTPVEESPGGVPQPGVTREEEEQEEAIAREGLQVEARTQWQIARRKFFQHKLAVGSIVVLFIVTVLALGAEFFAPYGYAELDLPNAKSPPTFEGWHLFGTDKLGRDYFSRVLYGTRTSIYVAMIVAVVSTVIGTIIGAISGYFGGWIDNFIMRFVDLMLTLPGLAVLLILAALVGRGSPVRIGLILALLFWTTLARIVRGSFLSLREKEFVEAAKASGATDRRIIFRHMLPNAMGPIIVNATLVVATAILTEAALSFLGFGIKAPDPALGKLIEEGRSSMLTQWWLVTMPGLTIVLIALCVNFIGDGLRDAFDPTQQEKA